MRSRRGLAALLLVGFTALARADVAPSPSVAAEAAPAPAVDVRDLPPMPEVVLEESVRKIAVVAARRAEEDIVTGAAKREQSLGNVASAVTVLSGDRLRRFGYRTVSEALRSVAGMYVTSDRMTDRLGIRGLQVLGDFNTRILVLIDGATVNEPWNQYVGISDDLPVSIDDVARIEVIRGPVSSVYGTNAFLAIINIITRGADQSKRVYGRATADSFRTVGGNAGFAQGDLNREVRGTVAYSKRWGETINVPEFVSSGAADNSTTHADGIDALNGSLVGHYYGAFAQVRGFMHTRQLAGAPYGTDTDERRSHNIDEELMSEAGYTRQVNKQTTVTVRGYFNRYRFRDFLVYEPANNFEDIGDSTWYGGEVRAHADVLPHDHLGVTVGTEVTFDRVQSHSFADWLPITPPNPGDPTELTPTDARVPTNFNVEGVYAEADTAPLPWASATGGLRFDRSSLFSTRLSPRAALFFHKKEDYGLKLLYAQGFRNPSPFEAFFFDNISLAANPNLKPESIESFEVVLWGRPRPGLSLRVSGFHWRLTDLVEQSTLPSGLIQNTNLFALRSTGLEVEALYRDASGWLGYGSATAAYVGRLDPTTPASFLGEHSLTSNAPALVAAAGVSSRPLLGRFHLSTELEAISARHTRDPATDAGAFVGWNAAVYLPSWRDLDFTLGARNLLDIRSKEPVSSDFDRTIPDPTDPTGMKTVTFPVNTLPGEGLEIYARIGYSY